MERSGMTALWHSAMGEVSLEELKRPAVQLDINSMTFWSIRGEADDLSLCEQRVPTSERALWSVAMEETFRGRPLRKGRLQLKSPTSSYDFVEVHKPYGLDMTVRFYPLTQGDVVVALCQQDHDQFYLSQDLSSFPLGLLSGVVEAGNLVVFLLLSGKSMCWL